MSDPVVRDVIRSVADNLEHEANRIERERAHEKQKRGDKDDQA